jgi:hypothetical protein
VVNLEKQVTERNVKIQAFVQKYGLVGPGEEQEEEAPKPTKKEPSKAQGGGVLVGGSKSGKK